MTIFDHLNSILFSKKGDNLSNIDDESTFQPYMINRWISMYSHDLTKIINSTTNRYYNNFSKSEYNQFLTTIIPKCRFKKIAYIKKSKKETDEDNDKLVKCMAKSQELSQREIRELVEIKASLVK